MLIFGIFLKNLLLRSDLCNSYKKKQCNLTIEYELRVASYSCELRKMRYVLHKIYKLPAENLSHVYKLEILAMRAFSYLEYI